MIWKSRKSKTMKITLAEYEELYKIKADHAKALVILQFIQDIARDSEKIDPGYHAILETLRDSGLT